MSFVSGLLDDARAAVGNQVDALRGIVDDRVTVLGEQLLRMSIVLGLLVVAAVLCGLAIAASLVAIGVPLWAALWSVGAVAVAASLVAIRRAKVEPPTSP